MIVITAPTADIGHQVVDNLLAREETLRVSEGLDNVEPRTPQNTTPTTFRQWCEEVLTPAVLA